MIIDILKSNLEGVRKRGLTSVSKKNYYFLLKFYFILYFELF